VVTEQVRPAAAQGAAWAAWALAAAAAAVAVWVAVWAAAWAVVPDEVAAKDAVWGDVDKVAGPDQAAKGSHRLPHRRR
jgi:hypothetical protein